MLVIKKGESFRAARRVPPACRARAVPTRSMFTRLDDVEFFRRMPIWARAADWGQSTPRQKRVQSFLRFQVRKIFFAFFAFFAVNLTA
jgi:hypothetical protein